MINAPELTPPRARLSDLERIAFRQLYAEACLLGGLAARLDDHADRREFALGEATYPQQHDRAKKVIADLRSRARDARADQAVVYARMDEMRQRRLAS